MEWNLTQHACCSHCDNFGTFYISLNGIYIKYDPCGHIVHVATGKLLSQEEADQLVRDDCSI